MFLFLFLCHVLRAGAVPLDPCAAIAGRTWASPLEVRKCLFSEPLNETIRANTIEVLNKTLAFHASVNYQVQAPKPFEDVHEDLHADLARFSVTNYSSDFAFHLDVYRAFKRLNDGHAWCINYCYDSLYISYIPTPVVLLTDADGSQNVHIAPEAFAVASAEFGDEIAFWQDSLPGELRGQLSSLSGARVLLINGEDPFVAVDANARVTGGYQALSTRQNSFFASYQRVASGWSYSMGNFALHAHPLTDAVELVVQRVNSSSFDVINLPYRSRFGSGAKNFTDYNSWRANNCLAQKSTNGIDIYAVETLPQSQQQQHHLQQHRRERKHPVNMIFEDAALQMDIDLPKELQPMTPPLNESYSVAQFYLLPDNVTGILALGSFSATSFDIFQESLLAGLEGLKKAGTERLIVDVTNNGGGYICIAHWLHRIIVGPKGTTEPQAGLDTKTRAGPLAHLIVKRIVAGGDPEELLSYNGVQWKNATGISFESSTDWLEPHVKTVINGREDAFSQRLGQECQPFSKDPPDHALFDPKNVAIVSNGRCGSSCSLFSITMAKLDHVKTVVVGGKKGVQQQYCGVVGGQSTDWTMIDTEIKSVHLKNHSLAPPDFIGNLAQGITWRLGFGLDDPEEPEEWQDHPADFNLPLTMETVNKPAKIWEQVASTVFG
ncbi:hypothetical protein C8J56DRAFT_322295 [Mycena floridula]|nr:hypothetical protein C8J56DRAFT_322295 [Mycena floridula]